MPRSHIRTAVCCMCLALFACRRAPITAAPAPVNDREQFCWWTFLQTALPPDSVATRFERAYVELGLRLAERGHNADTSWVRAESTSESFFKIVSGAVAYTKGDSTSLRYYVKLASVARDSTRVRGPNVQPPDLLETCGRIARAAGILWSRPSRQPNHDDSLEVWRRAQDPSTHP